MKTNYQLILEETIKKIDDKVPTLLLHSCCAPCSSYVIEYLSDYFNITVLYYNPNIEPFEEYEKRLVEQKKFINNFKSKYSLNFIDSEYETDKYREIIKGLELEQEGGKRCQKCIEMRLKQTFLIANEYHFDYFGTTLTVSPHKNSELINSIGLELETDKTKFLLSDFKKKDGYKRSIELSKQYDLYRQDYCGCLFSKREEISD